MSTPVDTSLTSLKEITAKIMDIITGAWQFPPGHSHFSLTTQADAVRHYGSGPYLPGLVWPNWHSIGYDDTHLLMHPWCSKVLAWEELGDHTFDLPVMAGPSVGPIPVDLPPSPVIARPSTNPASKSQEKGKGKAVVLDPEPGSGRESEEEVSHDSSTSLPTPKLISHGVLEVVLPWLSPDVARTSGSPWSPQSLKKKPFGPATAIASKCLEVIELPQATPEPLVEAAPACHKMEWPCATWFDKRTGAPCMSCIYCTTKKIKCISVNLSPEPPGGPDPGPLPKLPPKLQPPSNPPAGLGVNLGSLLSLLVHLVPKHQRRKHAVTARLSLLPRNLHLHQLATVPSLTSGVFCLAFDVLMPDLHAMAMVIWEGAAQIAALEEHLVEQDAKIDTLQCLHEGLQHEIILWHPAFPLPDAQGDATSFLLDQPVPPAMSTPASALPPLIDLSMEGMEPKSPNLQDESVIDGLIFELNQIYPEVSQMPGKIVKLDDPGNLFPEYDSVEEMDVQVKGEPSGKDVDMTT
ncbi:uncharacterized protein EDB93DRAFT_1104845 [Suillus bovinus]|uniref:uncharacterized protein n=1 Tax=Suillus bovinus TaxID=48563 RepID=UPI001B85BCED|nr:uncharacterized protein EDB93DRAFT_1104845 [Suillus bovinus]KAG2145399.1 hypothetical protein EDB93DRAFT_1104845 [Suillus bovinus]